MDIEQIDLGSKSADEIAGELAAEATRLRALADGYQGVAMVIAGRAELDGAMQFIGPMVALRKKARPRRRRRR